MLLLAVLVLNRERAAYIKVGWSYENTCLPAGRKGRKERRKGTVHAAEVDILSAC